MSLHEQCLNGMITRVTPTHLQISFETESDCKGCSMNVVCSNKVVEIEKSPDMEQFKTGQKVQIQYQKVFQTTLIIYVLPIMFFFAGILFTKLIFKTDNELILFLGALFSTGISLIIIHHLNNIYGETKYRLEIKPFH